MKKEQITVTVISSTGPVKLGRVKTNMPRNGAPSLQSRVASYEELKPLMSDKPLRGPWDWVDKDK